MPYLGNKVQVILSPGSGEFENVSLRVHQPAVELPASEAEEAAVLAVEKPEPLL